MDFIKIEPKRSVLSFSETKAVAQADTFVPLKVKKYA
jgi:hypothetical protein